jgi:DUF1016 N-terminal domain
VNRDLILLYWDIGKSIVERLEAAEWGESVIEQLSSDLRHAFPQTRGFSARNLRDMRRFFISYSDQSIWRQLAAKISPQEPAAIWRQPVAKSENDARPPAVLTGTLLS